MEPARNTKGLYTLISDGDFSSLQFHPGELDWDDSYDPCPTPCNEPEIMPAELDDDSWWYSDAYTPDSKYEEWFLTTRHWVMKSKSRRYRGLFNPGKKLIDSNELENHKARDRCGDDDADDFHSLNSGSEPSQISSSASSVKSFNSIPREMSEDEEEIIKEDEAIFPTPTDSNEILENSQFIQPEVNNGILGIQNFQDKTVNSEPYDSIHENEGDFMKREIDNDNLITPDPGHGYERDLRSQGYVMVDYWCPDQQSDDDRTKFFDANEPPNSDVQESDNSFMFPSTNPFQYRESNESLHSSVLGPFRRQMFDGSVSGAEIMSRAQLSSEDSVGLKYCESPTTLLSPLNSGRLPFLSSSARAALSQENRYDRITYDVSSSLLPENKPNLETVSEEVLHLGHGTSECKPEISADNSGIPRLSTSSDQIPPKPMNRRKKSSRPFKPDHGHEKIRGNCPVTDTVIEKSTDKEISDSITSEQHEVIRQRNADFPIILESKLAKIMSNINCKAIVQNSSISEITLEEEKFLESISETNPFVTNNGQNENAKDSPGDDVFLTPRKPPRPKSGIPIFRSAIKAQKEQIKKQIVLATEKLSENKCKSKIPTPKPSPRNIKPAPISTPKIKPRTWTVPTPPRRRFGPKRQEDIVDDCTDMHVKPSGNDPSGYLKLHREDISKIRSKILEKSSSHQNCSP